MFERLRNRFFRQERDTVLPAQEDQRGPAAILNADPAQAPAPQAERSQAGQAAAALTVAAEIGPTQPEPAATAAVAQPPGSQQASTQTADPDLPKQQALPPGPPPLPHRPSQAANRLVDLGRDGVITIDNRRYHFASLPEDVRQLVVGLQTADRVIAHRRDLRRLLLAARRRLTAQLQRSLQAHTSLPEAN
jgi:Family of unknown function (DUF6447)